MCNITKFKSIKVKNKRSGVLTGFLKPKLEVKATSLIKGKRYVVMVKQFLQKKKKRKKTGGNADLIKVNYPQFPEQMQNEAKLN